MLVQGGFLHRFHEMCLPLSKEKVYGRTRRGGRGFPWRGQSGKNSGGVLAQEEQEVSSK